MSDTIDPRHVGRAMALQQLFTRLTANGQPFVNEELLSMLDTDNFDQPLQEKIVAGVTETATKIDPIIEKLAPAWPIKQIAPVDLIILRMGIWEAFISHLTPARVVINEAIELAKEFGGPNSGSFVNGVLGALLNRQDLQSEISADQPNTQANETNHTGENQTDGIQPKD